MAKLTLLYRDVARKNVEYFDRLAAFHGYAICRYHYYDDEDNPIDVHCGIGIADPERLLGGGSEPIVGCMYLIETDNIDRLSFIQKLHDFCTQPVTMDPDDWTEEDSYPSSVAAVMERCIATKTITPEDYKEIMTILANEE